MSDHTTLVRTLDFHRWDVHGTMCVPVNPCEECSRLEAMMTQLPVHRTHCRYCHMVLLERERRAGTCFDCEIRQ